MQPTTPGKKRVLLSKELLIGVLMAAAAIALFTLPSLFVNNNTAASTTTAVNSP
jgi:hypothetical protein